MCVTLSGQQDSVVVMNYSSVPWNRQLPVCPINQFLGLFLVLMSISGVWSGSHTRCCSPQAALPAPRFQLRFPVKYISKGIFAAQKSDP